MLRAGFQADLNSKVKIKKFNDQYLTDLLIIIVNVASTQASFISKSTSLSALCICL